METEEITIRVDTEAARAYRAASEQERRKLDRLLNLYLHDALRSSGSLQDLMRELSRKAQERGLTPEILETAGNWQGEFERPEQGKYEQREPL